MPSKHSSTTWRVRGTSSRNRSSLSGVPRANDMRRKIGMFSTRRSVLANSTTICAAAGSPPESRVNSSGSFHRRQRAPCWQRSTFPNRCWLQPAPPRPCAVGRNRRELGGAATRGGCAHLGRTGVDRRASATELPEEWRLRNAGLRHTTVWIPYTSFAWLIGVSIPVVLLSIIPNDWPLAVHLVAPSAVPLPWGPPSEPSRAGHSDASGKQTRSGQRSTSHHDDLAH